MKRKKFSNLSIITRNSYRYIELKMQQWAKDYNTELTNQDWEDINTSFMCTINIIGI